MSDFEGFEPSNTTPVPDILFDVLLSELKEAELKALLYIIRRTSGFKKSEDAISLSQFQKGITTKDGKVLDKGCGIKDRSTLIKALTSLETKWNCIESIKAKTSNGDNEVTLYKIRFRKVVGNSDHLSSKGSGKFRPPVVGKTNHRSGQNQPQVVGNSDPQLDSKQETVLQETVLQEESTVDSANADTNTFTPSQKNESPVIEKTKTKEPRQQKIPTPPIAEELPLEKLPWDAEKALRIIEQIVGKKYRSREKELKACIKIIKDYDPAEETYIRVINKIQPWYRQHEKLLHPTDLAANTSRGKVRFEELLEDIEYQDQKHTPAKNVKTQSSVGAIMTHDEAAKLASDTVAQAKAQGYEVQAQVASTDNYWSVYITWITGKQSKITITSRKQWDSEFVRLADIAQLMMNRQGAK